MRRPRQEHLALDLHQRGGHHEEIAGALDVDHRQDVEVVLELPGHARDGNVTNVDLLPLDQVEEQVERTAKDVEVDEIIHA